MKLNFIEVCGFRGFRDIERFDFGAGFTVISGRNGVGKSTVCDAIEFALTGEIGKYNVETAGKESVKDYIWWRGEGVPESYYVRASFNDSDGCEFTITRTREGGADKSDEQIEEALCQGAVPEDPIRQLVKTSIIRDEWIAALSLDLSETQRFELVRAALGTIEGKDLTIKAKAVVSSTDANVKRLEEAYEKARAMLSSELTKLSEASNIASTSTDVSAAIQMLDSFIPPSDSADIAARLDLARRQLQDRRRRLGVMGEAIFQGREIEALRTEYESADANEKRAELDAARAAVLAKRDAAKATLDRASQQFELEARANEIAKSLSILVEHGERVGLDAGHCPLCAAAREDQEFEAGLEHAKERISALAQGVNNARETQSDALSANRIAEAEWEEIDARWQVDQDKLATLRSLEATQVELLSQNNLPIDLTNDLDKLEHKMSQDRDQLVEVERALNALETSRSVSRLSSIDSRVVGLRRQVDEVANELSEMQAAHSSAKSLMKSVSRSSSEIVDERLALISPLLNELYQRIRPHADWRSIEYSIRGDVRRFLSLKVGGDLNPQFVFSSGQRRAAGLAFLLSVHLSRSWSRWSTLILDDPVQHVDDFRALHLVEVLSAFRQRGRQVICAVEDEALAELLCRRLHSTVKQPGRHYKIDVDSGASGDVVSMREIAPMGSNVLRGPRGAVEVG